MPQVKPEIETFAKIKVIGVGGGGGSAVNRMVSSKIKGVDFVVMNTDVQALHHNTAQTKVHIGKTVTRGLGAGMYPEVGRKAAEESLNEIREVIKGCDMVFITCGLGGGTGSGAGPIVASVARELGALTVAVVTKPFGFEGPQRSKIAQKAWEDLAKNVDAIITIPNDRILQMIDKKTTLLDSFKIVDDVLGQGVSGIAELITIPGIINVDFADVKTIMQNAGSALMGIGNASGENRAVEAAKSAISSPLLELSIDGARGILFTITGGNDITMDEVNEAAKVITSSASADAKIIFGSNIDEGLKDSIKITVIATGFDERRAMSDLNEEIDTQSFFSNTNKIPASSFMRKVQKEEEEQEKKFKALSEFDEQKNDSDSVVPTKPARRFSATPAKQDKEEEDLEIPAFIRKKMGM
ncbi:MAG: cell division protein FtsZ [Candidatus Magasanikbacteria bacterium CG10_big_fil_rev_8_21_14_0_10_40_10]|uniref:Cell division protein FtsZ n=1 Tax=Candidatus Magasanikbacteria bacterium CG10_big_fil_rev_8_21_14_0_10_40_10 TaxID=1974648 RepID=A0A2M6W3G7_9BACT|nr:MAG: cell division protein FtsZ [Candidatus Magasanikbacteria bacterium CG10_big_fil_rev_8_21_14_0_10_40_10]